MIAINNQDCAIEKLCNQAIEGRLGDISGLPEKLKQHVNKVYREFISSYLNILRQSEGKPADWMPEILWIDPELTDGMRHFYSDYQHVTKKFYRLNQKLDRLLQTDKDRQFHLYQTIIDDILYTAS
ncbi:MAG: hypothetical protein PVF37_07720 [Desulfobacterales bacterium]|jgi:hypothetical protein